MPEPPPNVGPPSRDPPRASAWLLADVDLHAPPPTIPEHELIRPIAAGSYGEVWLARNAVGTPRAVKLVRRDRFERGEDFEREFNGLQKFEPVSRSHEGLVDILSLGLLPDEAGFYYVMELADAVGAVPGSANAEDALTPSLSLRQTKGEGVRRTGEGCPAQLETYSPLTLRAHFRARGALPAAEVISLGRALTGALAYLHEQGLVHRDIKPSNILFVGGVPKLADAGLVAAVDDARSLVGTIGYLAPEGPGSPRADLYALGKVLYEAAFGKDRQDFPQLPSDLATRPDHARLLELNAIIARACAHDPQQRYASAGDLLADLDHLAEGRSVKRRHLWHLRLKLGRKLAVVTALVALLIVGFLLAKNELARQTSGAKSRADSFENSGTTNRAAWEAYQKAVFFVDQQSIGSLPKAVTQFQIATQLDPGFSDAYAGMASAYLFWFRFPNMAPKESYDKAEEAARKALAMKPHQAEALAALGFTKFAYRYQPTEAEAHLREAVRLDPNNVRALQWLAMCLSAQGKSEEAVSLSRRALGLNPTSLPLNYSLVHRLLDAHRFGEAIQQAQLTLELVPKDGTIWWLLGLAYRINGQWSESRDAFLKASELGNSPQFVQALTNAASAREGVLAYARMNLEDSERDPVQGLQNPIGMAMDAMSAGEYEKALHWLDKSVDAAESWRTNVHPIYDPLRNDPRYAKRFADILRRMGFPP